MKKRFHNPLRAATQHPRIIPATNLARQVAIKVLPEAVAADAERLARFDREAKTLAALNHSNIAAIYGLEKSAGTTALVMELVEGPTLADRIGRGPIPIDEALPIAKQVVGSSPTAGTKLLAKCPQSIGRRPRERF